VSPTTYQAIYHPTQVNAPHLDSVRETGAQFT